MEPFKDSDRFTVERVLGQGGSGVVYQVFDRERNTRAALKMLRRPDASGVYRLKQEFRSLADLSHPNLVTLYELFSDGEQWYFTMELVEGLGFVRYVRGEPGAADYPSSTTTDPGLDDLPTELVTMSAAAAVPALPIARLAPDRVEVLRKGLHQLVTGLTYLHRQGRLHRDIKSSNVLVTPGGRVVLLDFGLVSDINARPDEGPLVRGTVAYMSPEQLARGPVTAASDWYSVGVMLFETLTGRLPFTGSYLDVLDAKRRLETAEPRELVPSVPAELNDLCRDLLMRDPARRPGEAEMLARLGRDRAGAPPAADRRVREAFVGRAQQLAALTEAFELARQGRTVVACVHGSSGMGKTALVRQFMTRLREQHQDAVVLPGRCYERESVPYKALDSLVDALSHYLMALPRTTAEALLPRDVAALARVFPVLRRVEAVADARRRSADIPDSQELRRRAFQAFRELVARMADRQPLVMFIDDLQWGDVDSAAVVAEMLRPPDAPSLLFIAAYRTEEADTSPIVRRLHEADLSGATDRREVRVGELTAEESRALARALVGEVHAAPLVSRAEALARESGGNPFFLQELVRDAETAGAPADATRPGAGEVSLEDVIHRRIARLPAPARQLVEALAVFGRPVDLSVAARAADVEPYALDALVTLRAANLVRTRTAAGSQEVEPYHDRIRETLLRQLHPAVLRALHGRFAIVLETTTNPDPETLAVHFRAAGEQGPATRYAVRAAVRASDALAFDRAADLYRMALEMLPPGAAERHQVEVSLGDALAKASRGRDAAQVYLAAARDAKPTEALELTRRAAEQFLRAGYIDDGFSAIRAVLAAMRMKLAQRPQQVLAGLILRRAWIRLRGLRFRRRDASEVSAHELMRIDACWSLSMGIAIVDTIRGADFQARHLLLALRAGEPYRVARAVAMEAAYSSALGERKRRRTDKLFALAERLANECGHPHAVALVTVARGTAGCMLGDWRKARDLCQRADVMLREQCTGVAWELSIAHLYALFALSYLGELRELGAQLPQYLKEAGERDDVNTATNVRTRIAYIVRLTEDRVDLAEQEVRDGIAQWSQSGFHAQHYFEMYATTEIRLYAGDGAGAWRSIGERWPRFRRSLLWRVDRIDIEAVFLRARAALAASAHAALAPRAREALLREATREARGLRRKRSATASALAGLVAGGIAIGRGRVEEAVDELRAAERMLAATDMELHRAAAARRCGELIGGEEGARLIADADGWMRAQGIRRPDRMTEMLAPAAYLRSTRL